MLYLIPMNNKIRTTILGGLLSASIASPALAGDFSEPIEVAAPAAPAASDAFSFGAGYHSIYLWRGTNLASDLVDWSLETSTSAAGFDLTAGVWAARDNDGGEEVDVYASASKELGFATVEVGYILYYFDNATSSNTQEVYLGLSKEVAGFDLSVTSYYDFDQADEFYTEFGASKSIALPVLGDVDASVAVGLNDDADFTHAQATLSQSFDLNSAVSVTPYVSYSYALKGSFSDEFVAGASLGFSF